MPSNFGRQENECHPILDFNKHHPFLEDKKHPILDVNKNLNDKTNIQIYKHPNLDVSKYHPNLDDKKNIQFWMLTNIIHFWKTRNIHFWMIITQIPHYIVEKWAIIIHFWMSLIINHFWMIIAQILHYNREMHNDHPKVDDYCSSTIIIHFWMSILIIHFWMKIWGQ